MTEDPCPVRPPNAADFPDPKTYDNAWIDYHIRLSKWKSDQRDAAHPRPKGKSPYASRFPLPDTAGHFGPDGEARTNGHAPEEPPAERNRQPPRIRPRPPRRPQHLHFFRDRFTTNLDGPAEHEGETFVVLSEDRRATAGSPPYIVKLRCGAVIPADRDEVESGWTWARRRPWQKVGHFRWEHREQRDERAVWTACPYAVQP